MLTRLVLAAIVVGGTVSAMPPPLQPQSSPPSSPPARRLVWSDEFDTPGAPDPSRWSYDVGGGGWGNHELEFYTRDRRENARVEDGHLIIEARPERWEKRNYTSARLVTKGKGDWTHARIEVRARLPKGRGSWPAIWLLATTQGRLRWPDDGEVDIMEHVGFDPGIVHGSIHTRRYNHIIGTQKTATIAVPDAVVEPATVAVAIKSFFFVARATSSPAIR